MTMIFKKAERTARKPNAAPIPARAIPAFRNRVAFAAAMEVLG